MKKIEISKEGEIRPYSVLMPFLSILLPSPSSVMGLFDDTLFFLFFFFGWRVLLHEQNPSISAACLIFEQLHFKLN